MKLLLFNLAESIMSYRQKLVCLCIHTEILSYLCIHKVTFQRGFPVLFRFYLKVDHVNVMKVSWLFNHNVI